MEKLVVATKYHEGLLDTHLNQGEVNVMIKENKTKWIPRKTNDYSFYILR